MSMLDIKALSVALGRGEDRRQILDEVSLSVARGETFGIVGESGSGKSTVLRCIAGLHDHWTGQILFEGAGIGAMPRKVRCRRMQMVFQDPYGSLHPRHTVGDILSAPLKIHGIGDRDRRVMRILEQVGLDPAFRFRFPHQLSGGQRQRVAIGRALVLEPELLLLDEPTSALDVSIQAEVLNLFKDLQEELGLTYVLVSHDLGVIDHMCERFAVVREGTVLETLTVEALRAGDFATAYTRELVQASAGYVPPSRRSMPAATQEPTQ